ncbi:Solute carrier family 12 [Trichuris trichiura]|uniref:Solute carrier family 12 member 9 n=1 Tax=Trichuris trichiura TaxID=36087 RepID=A0A077Z4Q7_TRITR|nr:Solute carrier family 12 [Trichuris trichiura]
MQINSLDDNLTKALDKQEITTEEQSDRASWLSALFYGKQHGFGTWDGVFTTVVINTFGITVFLRSGWLVANAGVGEAMLVLLLGLLLAIVPVLSAIAICERCQIQNGGVFFLISHVLGTKIGGTVGLIFILGQIIAGSMVAVGFGESMASLIHSNDEWVARAFALGASVLLLGTLSRRTKTQRVNVAGIKWVIRTQIALLCFLFLAIGDFVIGALATTKPDQGMIGISAENFKNNFKPDYGEGENFFTVFGVYFSTFTGILSGVNMSGDLKDPVKSIPLGELAGLGVSVLLALVFILSLGAVGERSALHNDINFVQKVSLTGMLLLGGIYVSSLSAIINGLYVSPRLLQSIAAENVIAFMRPLQKGRGPNNEPIIATILVALLTVIFIFVGGFNLLAKIATLPYLTMYAFINYSYFSLGMSFDLIQIHTQGATKDYGSVYKLPQVETEPFPSPGTLQATSGTIMQNKGKQQIMGKRKSWYSYITNRWIALVGAILNVVLIFFINWQCALILLALFCTLYFYISRTNPCAYTGVSQFSIYDSIGLVFGKREPTIKEKTIITHQPPGEVKTEITQVTGHDYAY